MFDEKIFTFGIVLGVISTLVFLQWYKYCFRHVDVDGTPVNPLRTLIVYLDPTPSHLTESCVICTEEYIPKQSIVECPSCSKLIGHAICVSKWVTLHPTCPYCRVVVSHEVVIPLENSVTM